MYEANARIIVNDDTREKSTNLLEAFKIDARNITNETEREVEVLRSKDLLHKLVVQLQLNVQYSQKGFVREGQFYENLPITLELADPDSIRTKFTGEVKVVNGQVSFMNELFAVDTFSAYQKIRWCKMAYQ